ncbi:MAG: 2-hydroxychromene-2-carboxylate isomerase [Sedimentitalea sp.]
MADIAFFYDFGSPNAYLMHKVLPSIAARYQAKLTYHAMLLGGVFKATNNQSPMMAFANVPGKLAYQRLEMMRFVERHGLAFQMNPHFPVMTIGVMRGAVYAQGKPWETRYLDTVFDAMWVHGQKMDDPNVIGAVLDAADLPANDIISATQTPDIKAGLIANTETAVARGVFGAPTVFLGDEMFYGKDSLADLEWRLAQE